MIATILSPATTTMLQQLNRRGAWEFAPISGRNANEVLKAIEGSGAYSHVLIDIEAVQANVDVALDIIERLRKTTGAEILVIAQGHERGGVIFRDILSCGVAAENILTDNDTLLKRELQQRLPVELKEVPLQAPPADDTTSAQFGRKLNDEPEALVTSSQIGTKLPPPEPNAVTPSSPAPDRTITPPSQVPRDAAKQSLIFKPPIHAQRRASVVAIAGAGSRMGTTTQAMQMLLYLRAQDRTACVVEMHGRPALELYIKLFDERDVQIVDAQHFRINGCDIFRDPKSFLRARKDFDFVILDYGRFEDIADATAFLDKDIKVMVCGVKPWESSLLENVFAIDDGSVQYVFSFAPPNDHKTVRAAMLESSGNTFFAPYSPDLFGYCGDDALYVQLLQLERRAPVQKTNLIDRMKGVIAGAKG